MSFSPSPVPLSPVVVNDVPEYAGVGPTPSPSPPTTRATFPVDDHAPCPPTPICVPLSAEQDQLEWLNSRSISYGAHDYWFGSEPVHSISFADPLPDGTLHDHAQYDDPAADSVRHVSDHLLYARETYASPNAVMIMMRRASLDMHGLETQPVNPWDYDIPLKLFSLTGGWTPKTGFHDLDWQSSEYYNMRPYPSPLRDPECHLSYRYPISSIEAVQYSLCTKWSLVYPTPIPPVIIRSRDLIGPSTLSRRADGRAFVVPIEDSIWGTILRRGVDLDYRPKNPSLTVETDMVSKGGADYFPQHTVAAKFAVNIFLELSDFATNRDPLCEYMGAYVLQAMDGLVLSRDSWMDIDHEVKRAVFRRVPYCFKVLKNPFGWPQLPYVRFLYYKWDRNIVGLADEIDRDNVFTASQGSRLSGFYRL